MNFLRGIVCLVLLSSCALLEAGAAPWWNDTVFYEVFVRSFRDSGRDGIGDLKGLIEKLDYLNDGDPATTSDLGVTGLWLMPVAESPSYHGYDVTDYRKIEPDYGTQADFKELVAQAHRRGIKVIVDLVLNHTSVEHPWFLASDARVPSYRDWYLWKDQPPAYKGPWGQEVWSKGKSGYYYSVFWKGMPDLNLENPEVTAEINAITRFWAEEMKVDGFRLDAIKHYIEQGEIQENSPATHAWLREFHRHYKGISPGLFTVGEAWTGTDQVLDYTGDEVDIAFEFNLAGAFMAAANGPSATPAMEQMRKVLKAYPENQFAVFLANHDQDRTMSRLKDEARAKLAAVLLLTSPGVPFIYYGEEIGMRGVKPDEDIRLPMAWDAQAPHAGFSAASPWRPLPADAAKASVAAQAGRPDSLLSLYRGLIQLRAGHPALRRGKAWPVETGAPSLYALLRQEEGEAFLVLANVGAELKAGQYGLDLAGGPFKAGKRILAQAVLGLPTAAGFRAHARGGFSAYHPYPGIPALSHAVLRLSP